MTFREALEKLPEPYKTQAIENTTDQVLGLWCPAKTLNKTLDMAFVWEETPQGHDYWEAIYYQVENIINYERENN